MEVLPAWILITPLVGVVTGALFFLLGARSPASLATYVLIGVLFASIGHAVGIVEAGDPPFSLGEVHLVASSLTAWFALVVARWLGV
jgi:hypothetical protein